MRLDPNAASLKPKTDSHVWLAPREVRSTFVVNDVTREAEKYLFYRGVGNLDAPIVVREEGGGLHVSLRDNETGLERLPRLWVVEVMPDKRVRYLTLRAERPFSDHAGISLDLREREYRVEALTRELAAALTSEGLYTDEAAAMLATWRLSYFESEGLRVFFLLPQVWTEAHLPLSISTPADITRVMVGRVELVTARQRGVLQKLYALPEEALPTMPLYAQDSQAYQLLRKGGQSHSELYRAVGARFPSRCSFTNPWAISRCLACARIAD